MPDNEDSNAKDVVICYRGVPVLKMPKDIAEIFGFREKGKGENMSERKTYIGVKAILAWPEEKDGKPGYGVKYPDGYVSWSPKAVFEAFYFQIDLPNSLTQNDIDRMIDAGEVFVETIGEKTTLVRVVLPTGFEMVEASACVDPANYSEQVGAEICMEKIKDRLWFLMGFTLQWAHKGLKSKGE